MTIQRVKCILSYIEIEFYNFYDSVMMTSDNHENMSQYDDFSILTQRQQSTCTCCLF